jgi:hypothetical protein
MQASRTTTLLSRTPLLLAAGIASAAFAGVAFASHSWGSYHWARTANPFTLKLGGNVTAAWDSYLSTTSADWSLSSVLDTIIVAGQGRKNCRATAGRVEVCNAKYGNNGWLGIAQIWAIGSHITQGTVKLNDTYFNTATYNTPAWRNLVTCQEVGHTFGLNHQDEDFSNLPLGTCMDYSNNPNPNQHPNTHDYEQLELIYAHLDTTTTVGASVSGASSTEEGEDRNEPKQWGKLIRGSAEKGVALYELNLGNGKTIFTHVIWADGEPRGNRGE